VEITTEPIDLNGMVSAVVDSGVGAVATFLGTVRDTNDGRAVTGIDYEAYQPMAEREMRGIAEEVAARWPGVRVAVVHRVGTLRVGDVSVAIACAHARRAPAADAMREAIESLKLRVPIWKREHYADGDWTWVDPTRPVVATESS
jgi:molybdopterin synthase catalytic subunit